MTKTRSFICGIKSIKLNKNEIPPCTSRILEFNNKENVSDVLNELLRDGAQQLIHQAVESELSEYLSQHQRLTDDGRVALVRNG